MDAAVIYAVLEGALNKVRLLLRQENTRAWGLQGDLEELSRGLERLLHGGENRVFDHSMHMLQNLGKAAMDFDHLLDDYCYETEGNTVVRGTMNKVRNFFSSSNPLVIRSRMAHKVEGMKLLVNKIYEISHEIMEAPFQRHAESSISIIKSSFDALPSSSLKQCFAYCAIFQKGSTIERKTLIQQWMAHEFLLPHSEQQVQRDPEDIGREYFDILLQKSLFQDVELDVYGEVKSCKMLDLVHDFALEISKGYCLTMRGGSAIENMEPVHLCITSNGGQTIDNTPTEKLSRLRTLFLYRDDLPKGLSSKCKYLRAFVMRDSTIEKLPDSIDRLKFLAYLDIIGTRIRTLPNSITTLKRLQTLRVNILLELPRDFHKLFLRHFYIETKYHILLPQISRMPSLHTLPYFVVSRDHSGCQIGELDFLGSLEGSLSIYDFENVRNFEEATKANLRWKENIVNLELYWNSDLGEDYEYTTVLEGLKLPESLRSLKIVKFGGQDLPQWITRSIFGVKFFNLFTITLKGLNRCQQIPILGHLPLLKVLDIRGMECVESIGPEFYGSMDRFPPRTVFPSLKYLTFENMPNLEKWSDLKQEYSWRLHDKVFPVLEILKISGAPRLKQLPAFSDSVSSLKEIRLYECNSLSHLREAFPSLEELELFFCSSLVSIPDITQSRHLRRLAIWRCNKLAGLPAELDACTKLEELEIDRCSSIRLENLRLPINLQKLRLSVPSIVDYEDFPWPGKRSSFPSLEYLFLKGNSKMRSLPEQIRYLPALRELIIEEFHQIDALPEWLCDIPSLRSMRVLHCRKLAHFPSKKALQRLTASCEVTFLNCPILKEKWKERRNQEWDKIVGITNIRWSN